MYNNISSITNIVKDPLDKHYSDNCYYSTHLQLQKFGTVYTTSFWVVTTQGYQMEL